MPYCPNCGTKVDDSAKVCPACNANLAEDNNAQAVENQATVEQQPTQQVVNNPTAGSQPVNNQPGNSFNAKEFIQNNKNNKKMIYGVIAAVVVLLAIIIGVNVSNRIKRTINLNDYVTVEFDGYDKYGKASVDFDSEQFAEDFAEASSKVKSADDMFGAIMGMLDVDYSLSEDSKLSNGDEVTLKWDANVDKIEKKYKVYLKAKDKTFKVADLEEGKEVDPFENFEVEFSGMAPDVYVNVKNNTKDSVLKSLYYEIEDYKSSDIKVGTKIEITIPDTAAQACAEQGYILTQTSKEFECTGLDAYVTKLSEIPEKFQTKAKEQAKAELVSSFARNQEDYTISDPTYAGSYFMASKSDSSNAASRNRYIVVMKATVSNPEGKFSPVELYFPVRFNRAVVVKADGTVECDLTSADILGSFRDFTVAEGTYFYGYVNGFADVAKMKSEIVDSNAAKYDVEVSSELAQ